MFGSILQLMGFPAAKPLHSPAKEKTAARAVKPSAAAGAPSKGRVPSSPVQEQPPRRSTVKSASDSSKKVTANSAPATKGSKAVQAAEPAKSVKAATTVRTAVVKKSVKPPAKPTVKAAVVKAVTAKKPAPVAAVKKSAPPPVKAVPKSNKPVAVSKPVAPVARPMPVHCQKKSEPVTPVVETKAIASQTVKSDKKSPAVASPVPTHKAVAKPVAVPGAAALTSLGVPVRSGRPSSRLAQLTVPSMAQSVASNAAKSSFTQITATQQIASPTAAHVKKDPKLANNWKKKAVGDLTDEEVIAMPDQEYMNDTQMAFFRQKLVSLKDAILNNAGETTEHLREDTVVVPDPADRATIEEEHALELRTRDRERKLLKKIEQSINRIDAGDYGYCDETGEPIGVARLLARPTATLSLEAQQRRELKQKMFGD